MNALSRMFKTIVGGGGAAMPDTQEWTQAISADQPCGPNLEYDPEYAVLAGRLSPQSEVQYGKFKAVPAGPDWLEVERDARRLLLRSKDITLLVWFTRARVNLAGATGLLEGLGALGAVLKAFPKDVHPQHQVEGIEDPAVRANALAALCDPEGLLADVRNIVITGSTVARLTMREVEGAMAVPRSAYALDPEAVKRQLTDLHHKGDGVFKALLSCAQLAKTIHKWAQKDLDDETPDLSPLLKLLHAVTTFDVPEPVPERLVAESVDSLPPSKPTPAQPSELSHAPAPAVWQMLPTPHDDRLAQREQIRQLLGQVRTWVETNEPSSPISVLLKQAERMWGKRFSEIAHLIPADLLREWDKDDIPKQ